MVSLFFFVYIGKCSKDSSSYKQKKIKIVSDLRSHGCIYQLTGRPTKLVIPIRNWILIYIYFHIPFVRWCTPPTEESACVSFVRLIIFLWSNCGFTQFNTGIPKYVSIRLHHTMEWVSRSLSVKVHLRCLHFRRHKLQLTANKRCDFQMYPQTLEWWAGNDAPSMHPLIHFLFSNKSMNCKLFKQISL